MAYKRKSKTTSDGVKRTTTHNTKKGITQSTSTGNDNYRQTLTRTPDGKLKTTQTRRDAAGYVTRTTKTTGGVVKQKAPPRLTKKQKESQESFLTVFIALIFIGYAIVQIKEFFS